MLAIPAHQLYDGGRYKAIAYRAMQSVLPETVRARPGRGDLAPLFLRGLVERERATVQAQLDKPDALWRRYLRQQSVERMWNQLQHSGQDGAYGLALWYCVAIELWSEGRMDLGAS